MTLNMTIVAPWGVWQCSDHRVTWLEWDSRGQRWKVTRTDDLSMKHIGFQCKDGTALLTYSGLAKVGNDDVADWLRRLLRGQSRTVDETLIRIREAADAKLAKPAAEAGLEHSFLVGAFLQGRPWAVVITNLRLPRGSPVLDHFETGALRPDQVPTRLLAGRGADAISGRDLALLKGIARRQPAQPQDYSKILANIHRRAKQSTHPASDTISESCTTTFMPPRGYGGHTTTQWSSQDPLSFPPVPLVHLGIDMTEIAQVGLEVLRAMKAGQPLDDDEHQRRTEAAGRRSVEPPAP